MFNLEKELMEKIENSVSNDNGYDYEIDNSNTCFLCSGGVADGCSSSCNNGCDGGCSSTCADDCEVSCDTNCSQGCYGGN